MQGHKKRRADDGTGSGFPEILVIAGAAPVAIFAKEAFTYPGRDGSKASA